MMQISLYIVEEVYLRTEQIYYSFGGDLNVVLQTKFCFEVIAGCVSGIN